MTTPPRDPGDVEPHHPFLLDVLEHVTKRATRRVLAEAVLAALAVTLADYLTGTEMSFSALYLVPVLMSAGSSHRRPWVVPTLVALASVVAQVVAWPESDDAAFLSLWHLASRFFIFYLVTILVVSLREVLDHERRLARVDSLSGLWNARGFFDLAATEIARARRTGLPLTVAYVDIDDFKAVNDTLGHAEGNEVIARTGAVLRHRLRATDLTGGLGGDEFGMLLPGSDRHDAEAVLRSVHDALTELSRANGWGIGYSIGVVTFSEPPRSVDELLSPADKLMYEIKQSGKHDVRFRVG